MNTIYSIAVLAACAMSTPLNVQCENINPSANTGNIKSNTSPLSMKILLAKDLEGAQVEVIGGYLVYDPYSGKQLSNALTSS